MIASAMGAVQKAPLESPVSVVSVAPELLLDCCVGDGVGSNAFVGRLVGPVVGGGDVGGALGGIGVGSKVGCSTTVEHIRSNSDRVIAT